MSSIYSIIERLRSDSSRNFKMEVLASEKDNTLLKRVLVACLEPRINYYLKKIPKYQTAEERVTRSLEGTTYSTLEFALSSLKQITERAVTGGAAIKHLTKILESLHPDDAKVIELIIQRDLKAGVNVSTINKVFPKLISETPYMRCSLVRDMKKEPSQNDPHYSQVKADGSFVYIHAPIQEESGDGPEMHLMTRNGNVYNNKPFRKLLNDIGHNLPNGYVYHGEFLVKQNGVILPREVGNGMLNSVMQGEDFEPGCEPMIELWDVTPYHLFNTDDTDTTPYKDRYEFLVDQLSEVEPDENIGLIETRVVYSMAEAYAHYQECLERGLEGTILKQANAVWKDGTSKQIYKLKLEVDVDLVVKGFTEGKGKNADTFGSIICESSDGELRVGVSGFTDKDRKWIHENRQFVLDKIMTVKSNNLMETNGVYSLFLPRYVEIRNDKTEADTLEHIVDQFQSAIKKAA